MEQFDVLDVNGKPTGCIRDKGAALEDGQYYLGVHIYIYNHSHEFLLQQRSYDKAFLPGGWDVLLEHVIAGETSVEGAVRGLQEEMGLSVAASDLRFARRIIREPLHHMIDIYFLELDFNLDELVLQKEEVVNVKAVTKAEMLELVSNMHYRTAEYREFLECEIKKL